MTGLTAEAPRPCPLCEQCGGLLVFESVALRVVRVDDARFPAFYRVIWMAHVAEWTDLPPVQRSALMQVVAKVETVLREKLRPTKINLASLGNVVPHLHWHVVARFDWDSHFPEPIWGQSQREVLPAPVERLAISLSDLDEAVRASLCAPAPPFLS
jgi:diadenosine tetraphosphate (Ap4A) HIT family hydrolase